MVSTVMADPGCVVLVIVPLYNLDIIVYHRSALLQ